MKRASGGPLRTHRESRGKVGTLRRREERDIFSECGVGVGSIHQGWLDTFRFGSE